LFKLKKKNSYILKKNYLNFLKSFVYKLFLIGYSKKCFFLDTLYIKYKFSSLKSNTSLNYFHSNCYLSGRSRGNISLFGLSRIRVKELA